MNRLRQDDDATMIQLRSQFTQSGWFSRLLFPSEMQRYLLQFFIAQSSWSASSTTYEAQYRAEAAFGFCTQYHHFLTDNSLIGRFRRWLLDYLPAFNTSRLMDKWRFTQTHQLGEDEFDVLVANEETPAEAFKREILVFKQALANTDSPSLRAVYGRYVRDISIHSPLSAAPEGFAQLLITAHQKGINYKERDKHYGEDYQARTKMFTLFREGLPDFAGIIASLQRLNAPVDAQNAITVEQVIMLYKDNRLDQLISALNLLHAQGTNPHTGRSALQENPGLLKLLMNHPSPEHLSQGLVGLMQLGLCVKTRLLKAGEDEINAFDKLRIQQRALESTADTLTRLPEFYLKGVTTEAGVKRAFNKHFSEQVKRSERASQQSRKFDVRFERFTKLTNKYRLPKALEMSDFETSGLNVLRLAHHPHPERVVCALAKMRLRMSASFTGEPACVEGSANGWGFALGDKSSAFFNHVQSKGLHAIYHLLLDYSQIFLHEDIMPYWEQMQDSALSPVHFFNLYYLCIESLNDDRTPAGQASARCEVIEYLENISTQESDFSLTSETASTLLLIHRRKMPDDNELSDLTTSLVMNHTIKKGNAFECLKRLRSKPFEDAQTGISATRLLALTWIALQKIFGNDETSSSWPLTTIVKQLNAFQDAFRDARCAGPRASSSSDVCNTVTISP